MRGALYMLEYRITKYDPANRVAERYVVDDWTSFSDIGKRFNNVELTYEKYLKTETAYIDCCIDLLSKAQIPVLSVEQAESYSDAINIPSKISSIIELRKFMTACLREQCWFKLTNEKFFIHFGYDYYMYVGTALPSDVVEQTAIKYGLFGELFPSPYNTVE